MTIKNNETASFIVLKINLFPYKFALTSELALQMPAHTIANAWSRSFGAIIFVKITEN